MSAPRERRCRLTNTALVEPLTIAWHAVDRSPMATATTVLVVGGGPIGLAVVQVLKARGVPTVVVAEVSQQRREFAEKLGATLALDPTRDDVAARVRAMSPRAAGADIAFECSGVQAGFDSAMAAIRVGGTTTIVSLWEKKPVLDAFDVVAREKHILGAAICADGDFEAVIAAIASGRSRLWLVSFCASSVSRCLCLIHLQAKSSPAR